LYKNTPLFGSDVYALTICC